MGEDLAILQVAQRCATAQTAPPHSSLYPSAKPALFHSPTPKAISHLSPVAALIASHRFPNSLSNTADDSKPIARKIAQRLSTTEF